MHFGIKAKSSFVKKPLVTNYFCLHTLAVLVVAYFVYNIGPLVFPQNNILNTKGLGMLCESIIDVLFKSIYMLVIVEVHDTIFDRGARTERRLEELRKVSFLEIKFNSKSS